MADRPLAEVDGWPAEELLDGCRGNRGVVHAADVGLSQPLERVAKSLGVPVITISQRMSTISVYVGDSKHEIEPIPRVVNRANQALATLERYKTRLDEVSRQLSRAEVEDFVTLRDVMTVVQRLELVRRSGVELDYEVVELGQSRTDQGTEML